MELELTYPDTAVIRVPSEARGEEGWARRAALRFGETAGADAALVRRIEAALDQLVQLAQADRRTLLLVSVPGAAMAPFTIFVSETAPTLQEQAEFLWSPNAVLPPTPGRTPSAHLGEGFSATLLHREPERDFATRRWLFFGSDRAVGALLGPVLAPYALAVLEPIAEDILAGSRVDGFVPDAAEARLAELEAACARAGETWDLQR